MLLLLGFYFIERSGLLGAPCACAGGDAGGGGGGPDIIEKGPAAPAAPSCAEGYV